jgi:hypothetical protein
MIETILFYLATVLLTFLMLLVPFILMIKDGGFKNAMTDHDTQAIILIMFVPLVNVLFGAWAFFGCVVPHYSSDFWNYSKKKYLSISNTTKSAVKTFKKWWNA